MNKIKLVSEWQLPRTARKWQISGVKSPRWAADQLKGFSAPKHIRKKGTPERGAGECQGSEAGVDL